MSLGLLDIEQCDKAFFGKIKQNFGILNNIFEKKIIDIVLTLPPNPSDGDVYILNDGSYTIQLFLNGNWQTLPLESSSIYYLNSESNFIYFDGDNIRYLFSNDVLNIDVLPSDSIGDNDLFVYSKNGDLKKINLDDLATALSGKIGGGSESVPIGCVMPFASNIVPENYLLCDGSEISRASYSSLFNIIGTAHGAGNGTTTFRLPDYRERVLKGTDGTANRDDGTKTSRSAMNTGGNTGNAIGSIQDDMTKMPNSSFINSTNGNHNHTVPTSYHSSGGDYITASDLGYAGYLSRAYKYIHGIKSTQATTTKGNHTHTISGGDAITAMKNAYVNYIIKAK